MENVWESLSHENIFKIVEAALGKKLSNILIRRNSYINRVFEIEEYDTRDRLIVKFYRPNRWTKEMILEEHAFINELASKDIPVISPIKVNNNSLFYFDSIPFAIFPKMGGRALDEFDEEAWKGIGRLIGRIHLIGAQHSTSKRITWRPTVATAHHVDVLIASGAMSDDFAKSFSTISKAFISFADPQFNDIQNILLHGDCHRGNFIHRPGEGVYIVDFDDMSMGPPVQDLWMLLPDVVEKSKNELEWFFDGYETFKPFDRKTLEIIPVLRGMRIIHFASWCAIQKDEPHFDKHFPDWGSKRYWNELIKDLQSIVYKEDL